MGSATSWELIGPIILEATLRKSEAASLTPDRCSTASFSACAAGANGTDCQNWGTTAQSSHLSTVGGTGCLAPNMESLGGTVRRVGRRGLGGRRQTGPWEGVLGGPDWTQPNGSQWQQAKPLWKDRGPIEHCGCRHSHDATLLDETLEAIVVERPQLTEDPPRGMTSRRAVARHGYRPAHRRGEVGRSGRKRILRAGGLWNGL